ncbi:hypothetical protein P171DRAFT_178964 [Karstenula rhodostoma CBS 690.94]|uniref:PD-(D/E)XK nuclease-like domain-containing protein n=1 Tax=Karstenula rhodostoma CBS 690.94 TaxID=1392251 RepID=A0A9P4U5Z1_9PLEO|nr:hypothetical protein P171DRAFT_178964 [Karstenula rhodostoma CBS 690.94]
MATTIHPEKLVETVQKWLASTQDSSLPLTPPPEQLPDKHPHPPERKRKRAMSLPTNASSFPADMSSAQAPSHRSGSPKRRRVVDVDDDEVEPTQSASQIGSESVLPLSEHSTFAPPTRRASSSNLRVRSPTRETPIILKNASPPVLTESSNGIETAPPTLLQDLGDYLYTDTEAHFIPPGLKQTIKDDIDVGYQATKPADFAPADAQTPAELAAIWGKVKAIFLNARECKDGGRDENAWCDDVFRPLIALAMELYGDDRWWLQSV